jgi:hypothetical protein
MAGGEKERPVRKLVVLCSVLAMAWATTTMAGEEGARPKQATGTFVSAELAGDLVKWQFDLGQDAGKKTYEMAVEVKVQYAEKEGAKQAQGIRPAAGRDFRDREGMTVAKGKLASAKLQGDNVLVTITPAEGEKALEVTLPKKLTVMYREEGEKLTAVGISVPRPPAPKPETK